MCKQDCGFDRILNRAAHDANMPPAPKLQGKPAIDPDTNIIKLRSELNVHSENMAPVSKSLGAPLNNKGHDAASPANSVIQRWRGGLERPKMSRSRLKAAVNRQIQIEFHDVIQDIVVSFYLIQRWETIGFISRWPNLG